MPRYRKKPVEVEAVQWTGLNHEDIKNLLSYCNIHVTSGGPTLCIYTLEGVMNAGIGDYIIKGVNRRILSL